MQTDPDVLEIGGEKILRGQRKIIQINLARLYDYTDITMQVQIIRAKNPGPVFFLSGAIHGDEIIGPEVIKRFLQHKKLKLLMGTLIAVPLVNVFGFNSQSRYFPDRRDLNRSFPGSLKGSLTARVAHQFLNEIIKKCHYGIDIHSGAIHRANLPQIRACLSEPETARIAGQFGAPVTLDSDLRDGSLREAANETGVHILLFEGGEALRFDETVIRVCIRGIFNVLRSIGMVKISEKRVAKKSYIAKSSYWLRAPQSGVFRQIKWLGSEVQAETPVGTVTDVWGNNSCLVKAKIPGIIIGENRIPLVNRGDALFHIATFSDSETVRQLTEDHASVLEPG